MYILERPIVSRVCAREIFDSRGNPTIETIVELSSGALGKASVPSGASTGSFEAIELRDKDTQRLLGKGVSTAVNNVNTIIAKAIINNEKICTQADLDKIMIELDGTQNKAKLGANAILSVSMAYSYACSYNYGMELYQYLGGIMARNVPTPMMNIINGGAHADNKLDIQEFMIVPISNDYFDIKYEKCVTIYQNLKILLKQKGFNINVGDEGGFAPQLSTANEALDLIMQAIENSGYKAGNDIFISLDVAATELYKDKKYNIDGTTRTSAEMVDFYQNIVKNYPIFSIEDPMAEEDWDGWANLNTSLKNTLLIGDDLYVTNVARIKKGHESKASGGVLIKPNQVGTVSETFDAIQFAVEHNMVPVISHRSGETECTFISDLAVASGAKFIKSGAPARGERIAKYNRISAICSMM